MIYNNKFYKLAAPSTMSINISNSTTPAEFAANVFKVMESRKDSSVAKAIDEMARQNASYNNVVIREVPEIQELYKRVINHSGPIDENLLSTTLNDLIGNATPGQEQQQYVDAKNARATELQKEDELYQVMLKALSPLIGALSLKLENGEIWPILRERPEFVQALDNEAKKSSNYAQLVEKFNNKFRASMAPKQTLPEIRSSSSVQEFVQKLMQFAQEDRIERLDIALDQYWRKGGKLNGVDIMSIPAIKQIYQEAQVNPVRLDAASLTNRLNQLSGSGTQPQQPQSVSQMYNIDQNLSNYKRTMDLQMQSYNATREESFKQQFKAIFGMYSQYIRERQIKDKDYETYRKMYEMLPQQGQPLQENVERTRDTLGV
jgi:hypothetical protein